MKRDKITKLLHVVFDTTVRISEISIVNIIVIHFSIALRIGTQRSVAVGTIMAVGVGTIIFI